MATLTLTLDKAQYNKGDKITATYGLTGDDVPSVVKDVPITGEAVVDGTTVKYSGTVKVNTPQMHAHTFQPPVLNGVKFVATTQPTVWTGVA